MYVVYYVCLYISVWVLVTKAVLLRFLGEGLTIILECFQAFLPAVCCADCACMGNPAIVCMGVKF